MRSSLILMLLAVAGLAQAAPVEGIRFTHNDWTLACDNTRTCRAAGYQDEDGDNLPVSVLLTRKGGPEQKVSAQLMLGQYDETTMPARLALQINGKDLGALPLRDGTADLSETQTRALLASLARSSRIVALGNDGRRWTVSDRGATAVLLKMDEFQGRLDTPGALVRKGTRSEAAVLPALPPPTVTLAKLVPTRPADTALARSPALRAALAAVTSSEDCDALAADSMLAQEGVELTVKRLGKDTLLVSMPCWRGAYNEGSGYWVTRDRAPYQPVLVTTLGGDDDGATINAAHKGRGLGDCWSTKAWGWNGTAFVMTADANSGLCRLVAAGGAWEMPTLVTQVNP
ncbi:DUF1176 domain-containing protein [Stenotrophomonas sp. 24(2023)]|uniref:DUF1176 domain-containing protein n=1 Tax=Stenotrophomonas sp. 24(2023) TaxID=3068324 RepID=UPI0027DF119B|nr:DUF1176 domain-containing protein [Stenotrophomonas sp. 24(2023)]WMJ69048.1 DUF1176 domain-containing protein [Stenotrophomonas sp. 24(2023)]